MVRILGDLAIQRLSYQQNRFERHFVSPCIALGCGRQFAPATQ
jgi:hypothetical protein